MAYHKPKIIEPYPPVSDLLLAEIRVLSGADDAREFDPEKFPGYVVTTNGQIWSVRKANSRQWGKPKRRVLHVYPKGGGFLGIQLQDEHANLASRSVSRIVASTFIGEPPNANDLFVIHVDGDITNNNVSNLEWADMERFGENKAAHDSMKAQGEDIGNSRLTEDAVREIKRRCATEIDQDIADDYGVAHQTIARIRRGDTWQGIDPGVIRDKPLMPQGEAHHFAKLTTGQVDEIRKLYADGVERETIAARFGIHPVYIYNLVRGANWKHTHDN